jgi:outer membrane protein assembly factor BamB
MSSPVLRAPRVSPERRKLVIVLMWVAALAAMAGIYVYAERPTDPRRRDTSDVVEHDADDVPAGAPEVGPLAPPPDGPPREYRGDRRHTGRSTVLGPATARRAWSFHTEGNIAGQVVVGSDGTVYVGSLDHFLYAFGPAGEERWRRDLGGPVYSTPALDDAGHVFVGSDSDFFFCLDAATGEVVWHLRTEGDVDTGIAIAPDGSLVFGAGEHVWSVSPDGTARWRFRARVKVYTAPAIDDDGNVYFGAQDDHVYALGPDGTLLWRFATPDDVDSAVVIGDDGTLYFGGDDRLVRAIGRDGVERWQRDVDGYVRSPVALGQHGEIFVPVFGPRPRVVALDAATGEQRWDFPISAGASSDLGVGSSPVVDRDGNLYFGTDDFYVYALGADGALRWVFHTADRVDSDPILGPDGTLYFGSDDDWVYALR